MLFSGLLSVFLTVAAFFPGGVAQPAHLLSSVVDSVGMCYVLKAGV